MTPYRPEQLDDIDIDILRALQNDARLSTRQLAAKVHRSPTPVFERVKRMEAEGYIRRYLAVLDADKLGRGFVVFCQVKLRQINRDIASDFVRLVQSLPEVTECYNVSGAFDYLLKIHAPSMTEYRDFVLNKLGAFDLVGSIESTFVMSEIKHDYGIPL
ncbi:Lrp/AsnC family transcriptional regulator [uncultured Muribaculum sp.]|uniref:Lrp/AsnC family transcriptional regulator n=1 Tax=uncultured Muribaculum sp. TaxID=1918613 RepID=UPI0025E43067|nr:Lrp/AsnC family transcriptional regulator [uncultured Muribaculum sp.]